MFKMPAALGLAYLLGSIPTAYIAGRLGRRIDIREHGSGNMGTMNTLLVIGWPAAILVLAVDVAKGAAAFYLGQWAGVNGLCAVIAAVIGHSYPLWLKFNGGKGLATALGGVVCTGALGSVLVFGCGWVTLISLVRKNDPAVIFGLAILMLYAYLIGPDWPLIVLGLVIALRHVQVLVRGPLSGP